MSNHRPGRLGNVSPYLLLALCNAFWGSNMVAGRAVHELIAPATLSFGRWLVAASILLPIAADGLLRQRHIIRREWRILLTLAGVGAALFHTLVYTALNSTTAVNAGLFMSATPVVIVALSWLMFRDRISLRQGLGIATSLVGVAVILLQGELDRLLELDINVGDIWMLLAVPAWAYYSVLLRRRPAGLTPINLMAVTAIVALALLLPFIVLEALSGATLVLNLGTIGAVTYIGVFPTVLAFVFWNRSVAEVGANTAGQFLHLIPVFSVLLGILLLGEQLREHHVAGIGLIACGIYLATARRWTAG